MRSVRKIADRTLQWPFNHIFTNRIVSSMSWAIEEATMFGYGLIGTLVVIALVIWIVRAL